MPQVSDSWWKRFKEWWVPDAPKFLAVVWEKIAKLVNTLAGK